MLQHYFSLGSPPALDPILLLDPAFSSFHTEQAEDEKMFDTAAGHALQRHGVSHGVTTVSRLVFVPTCRAKGSKLNSLELPRNVERFLQSHTSQGQPA